MIRIDKYLKSQQGLSLIELLISMVLGSIAMIFATQIVMSTYSSKRLLNAEAELQENARFGISVINSIVQGAGSFGCRTSQEANTTSLLDSKDPTFAPWQVVEGWEASNTQHGENYSPQINAPVLKVSGGQWKTSAGAEINDGISSVEHSDVLKIWYTKGPSGALQDVNNGVLSFSEMDLEQGDVVVINDCKTVTFAQACSCDAGESQACAGTDKMADISAGSCHTPGNIAHTFNGLNMSTAEVAVLQQAIFFVSKANGAAGAIPSLYVARLGHDAKPSEPEEVLSYVENMQILYGEDTSEDNSPNYYVSGNSVTDWGKVVSIKISLLMRSRNNNLLPDTQSISFNGAQVRLAKDDRYLRRVYSSTISLRNRNIGY